MSRWSAPEAFTPDETDDEDERRRQAYDDRRLDEYEADPDGQERAWHEREQGR